MLTLLLKNKLHATSGILFLAILIALLLYLNSSSKDHIVSIQLDKVRTDLADFIINRLDKSPDDFSIECDSSGHECNKINKDPTETKIASLTWKLLFYSNLYAKSEDKIKQKYLDKALELNRYFLKNFSNQWNSQAYVFAYAYLNTSQVDFLRAFLYSSAAFTRTAITEKIFNYSKYHQIHPMELVRYAEQIILIGNLFQSVPPEILDSISFEIPDFKWIVSNKDLIVGNSQAIANKLLSDAQSRINNASYDPEQNLEPLKINGSDSVKLDVCWAVLGYALGYKHTSNIEFSNAALNILNKSGLDTGYFNDINSYYAQPVLACLNAYSILKESKQIQNSVFDNFLVGFLDAYLDSNFRKLCSKEGGILNFMPIGSTDNICNSNALKLSDNVWLHEIILETPDLDINLSHDFAGGGF